MPKLKLLQAVKCDEQDALDLVQDEPILAAEVDGGTEPGAVIVGASRLPPHPIEAARVTPRNNLCIVVHG